MKRKKVLKWFLRCQSVKDLIPIIAKKVKSGAIICSDTLRAYTGLATKGYVQPTVEHRKKEHTKGKNHINGLEGFWGVLKESWLLEGKSEEKNSHSIYQSMFGVIITEN